MATHFFFALEVWRKNLLAKTDLGYRWPKICQLGYQKFVLHVLILNHIMRPLIFFHLIFREKTWGRKLCLASFLQKDTKIVPLGYQKKTVFIALTPIFHVCPLPVIGFSACCDQAIHGLWYVSILKWSQAHQLSNA